MISREEIIGLSKLHGIRPWQEELRYMQVLILNSLYDEDIVFKGGTYLWLFHGLRRFSEDLDFTAGSPPDNNLAEIVSRNLSLIGINNQFKIIKNNNIALSFRIISNGPLNTGVLDRAPVYVEISKRENVIMEKIPLRFDFPEYNLPVRILSGMNLEEVLAEKVRAAYTRKKARDIYDIYFLITYKNVKFDTGLINQKLGYYNIEFHKNTFLNEIEMQRKNFSIELKNIVMDKVPDIAYIIETISSEIENI